jgi:hypothetical protein
MPTLALQATVQFNLTQQLYGIDYDTWQTDNSINNAIFINALQVVVPFLKYTNVTIYEIKVANRRRQLSKGSLALQTSGVIISYTGIIAIITSFE